MRAVALAFAVVLALGPASTQSPTPRRMAITIDDLPGVPADAPVAALRSMTDAMVEALRAAQAPAFGFVNEGKLTIRGETHERTALLETWLDAGVPLGNHTYSHPDLNTMPLAEYQRDVIRGEPVTFRLMIARDRTERFFRHPFTHTGPSAPIKTAFERFLRARGYTIAPFTVENADYLFSSAIRAARRQSDADLIEKIEQEYIAHTMSMLDFYEPLAREIAGREFTQILLIHVNELNAATLPQLLTRVAQRGYRFVTLASAMEDSVYRQRDGYIGRSGPSWIHRWRATRGLPSMMREEPEPPAWILRLVSGER